MAISNFLPSTSPTVIEVVQPPQNFPPIAVDAYVATRSMSTNGGRKFLADSRGHRIFVYVKQGEYLVLAVNNGDPRFSPWIYIAGPRPFIRPAAVLQNDNTLHIIAERLDTNVLAHIVVHLTRDTAGGITGANFHPYLTSDTG